MTQFSEHLIFGGFTYGFGVQAADIDGDGWLEITVADTAGNPPTIDPEKPDPKPDKPKHSHIYWFKNDGHGKYSRHFVTKDDLGVRLERHVLADINRDGLLDIVVVDNFLGDLLWYENPGLAGLAAGQLWQKHYITRGGMFGAEDLTVADFDGDGWPDVAAAGWRLGNCFKWFRNPGKTGGEWEGRMIDGGFPVARCILAGDINGDGRPDLFATSDASRAVLWYECPADPLTQPWQRHVIDLPLPPHEPVYARLLDMNGDGRLDALVAMGGQWNDPKAKGIVAWYENLGVAEGRIQWRRHIVSRDIGAVTDVVAGDIRGVGRPDVVAVAHSGEVAWFENPGVIGASWIKHSLKQNWPQPNQVILADLDRDGRLDIAAVADYGSMELRWWRNHG